MPAACTLFTRGIGIKSLCRPPPCPPRLPIVQNRYANLCTATLLMDPLSLSHDINKAQKATVSQTHLRTTNTTLITDRLLSIGSSLWLLVLSNPALREGIKFIVLGGALDAVRQIISLAWTFILGSISVTAEFEEKDETYSVCTFKYFVSINWNTDYQSLAWMMFWLSRQQSWCKSRHNTGKPLRLIDNF